MKAKVLELQDYGTDNKRNTYNIAANLTMPHPEADSISIFTPGPHEEGNCREYGLSVRLGFRASQMRPIENNRCCYASMVKYMERFGVSVPERGDALEYFAQHKSVVRFFHFDSIETWKEEHNGLIRDGILIGTPSLWVTVSQRGGTKYFRTLQEKFIQMHYLLPTQIHVVEGIGAMVHYMIQKYTRGTNKQYDFRIIKYIGIGGTSPMAMVVLQRIDTLLPEEQIKWRGQKGAVLRGSVITKQ